MTAISGPYFPALVFFGLSFKSSPTSVDPLWLDAQPLDCSAVDAVVLANHAADLHTNARSHFERSEHAQSRAGCPPTSMLRRGASNDPSPTILAEATCASRNSTMDEIIAPSYVAA